MSSEQKPKGGAGRGSRRIWRWFVWGIAGILLIFAALFAAIQLLFQINSVPADLQKPPAWFNSAAGSGPAAGASKPGHAFWNNPDPPKTYEDYVRFQLDANPGDQGAALYLELVDAFTKGNTNDAWGWYKASISGRDPRHPGWSPGEPLTAAQADWLAAHQDFIGKLRLMIAVGGPSTITREEALALSPLKGLFLPIPDLIFFQQSAKLLAADSQRVRDAGDLDGTADRLADLFSFGKMYGDRAIIHAMVGHSIQANAGRVLDAWLRDAPPPSSIARRLVASLDALRIPADVQAGTIAMHYETERAVMVELMNQPLGQAIQSLALITNNKVRAPGDDWLNSMIEQPRQTFPSVATAIWIKIDAAGALSEYDGIMGRYLPLLKGPYAGIDGFDFRRKILNISRRNAFRMVTPDYTPFVSRSFTTATQTNIDRAALRIISGDFQPANLDPAEPDWADSSWRDPFTEAPLTIVEDGDSTLVYSFGPDMKDDGGMIAYDPTNGTASAGDLSLRIPRRKSQE